MLPIKDTVAHIGFPSITLSLILVNAVIFLLEISIPKNVLETLFYVFGLVPARYTYPSWAVVHGLPFDHYLSFVTNMFLHAGWLHILGNMWFLYIFGRTVEEHMGHLRFLFFYLFCGVAANASYFALDLHSRIPEFGASGAIAGVMGAYIVMFPGSRILTLLLIFFFPLFIELSAFVYIGFWFALQLLSGTLSFASQAKEGGVAWWAHVGGFVAGVIFIPVFRRRPPPRKKYPDEVYRDLHR